MKKTALYDNHLSLEGRMVDFAGWSLPVMYKSIISEHQAVRECAGLFDISHMGEILIEGEGADKFLASLIPTRMDRLVNGKSMYSCFTLENGGILDDLFIFKYSDQRFYLVVNASRLDEDFQYLTQNAPESLNITDLSEQTAKIDLQGPLSREIALKLISDDKFRELKRFEFMDLEWNGFSLMVSATGYTGESGYEFYISNEGAVPLWEALLDAGRDGGLIACGLGARDSLRLESCYSLYGHEISDMISPVEGGLGWLISSDVDYPGKAILIEQKRAGVEREGAREMVAFELTTKGIPRDGYEVYSDGEMIGLVTSGCFSPTFQKGIGLALVKKGVVALDKPLSIMIRKKEVAARRVRRPIYEFKPWK